MSKEIGNIQALCADIVQKAKSGHPGAPLGLSQFVYILFTEFLNLNPDDAAWPNRDIFILSNGHACVIQYVMNYLLGYLDMKDLQSFRQLNSNTPGHPEKNERGIEVSTGPLGQGVAASVGFAISCKVLSNGVEKKGFIPPSVYCIFGDGCYQEGISQEAFSLCSRLGLDNITFIYDFNSMTIDGSTDLSMKENVRKGFESLNFDVIELLDDESDSNELFSDGKQIREALLKKKIRPKVIILHTVIGRNSELANTANVHGSPLGFENIEKLKQKFSLPLEEFYVTNELLAAFEAAKSRMRRFVLDNTIDDEDIPNPKLRCIFQGLKARKDGENAHLIRSVEYKEDYKSEDRATRDHLKECINLLEASALLISGSADLLPCIKSKIEGTDSIINEAGVSSIDLTRHSSYSLNSYIHYGIREHAMCGVMNGLAAHGVLIPIGGTFLNFAAYGMPSIKIACLDRLKTVYFFTHDSIGLGEDGPTHQPIEVLATLRALPNIITLRPCDGRETRTSLALAIRYDGPVALILTRQLIPELPETIEANHRYCTAGDSHSGESDAEKGAYHLLYVENPEIIIIATGSEVQVALATSRMLQDKFRCSVVSVLSFEIFESQSREYRDSVIPARFCKRNRPFVVSIEALSTFGWARYSDLQIGIDTFGRSAPYKDVFKYFEITAEDISKKVLKAMEDMGVSL